MTIGFSASSVVPKSLDEIWLRQADFPMLVDKEVSRRGGTVRFDQDLAEFFITVHTNYPFIDSRVDENLARLLTPRLVKLRRDYDSRGYGGLVNLDMSMGNPRSILSIAKTIARSEGGESVTEEHVNQAVTLFADSREDIFEAWSETERDFGFGQLSYRKEVQKTGKTGERIVTFLIKHPDATKAEIRAAISRVQDRIFNQAFNDLLKRNLIYQSDMQDDRHSATNMSW